MTQKITLTYFGVEGSGRTVSEAKKDAGRKIEAALTGDYDPFLIGHCGYLGLVGRDPRGGQLGTWGYRVIEAGCLGGDGLTVFIDTNYASRHDAIAACAYHLAQNAGTYAGLERHLAAARLRDLDAYFLWQQEYAKAKSEGLGDEECRARANGRH